MWSSPEIKLAWSLPQPILVLSHGPPWDNVGPSTAMLMLGEQLFQIDFKEFSMIMNGNVEREEGKNPANNILN